jgi:CheY-like chemotaxis protein
LFGQKSGLVKWSLADEGLPEMDGNKLAQQLRPQPETARSVLIAVTGYGQEKDRKQTLASGFDHHLVKPGTATAGQKPPSQRLT